MNLEEIKRDLEGRDDNSSAYATVHEVRELIYQLTAAKKEIEGLKDARVLTHEEHRSQLTAANARADEAEAHTMRDANYQAKLEAKVEKLRDDIQSTLKAGQQNDVHGEWTRTWFIVRDQLQKALGDTEEK